MALFFMDVYESPVAAQSLTFWKLKKSRVRWRFVAHARYQLSLMFNNMTTLRFLCLPVCVWRLHFIACTTIVSVFVNLKCITKRQPPHPSRIMGYACMDITRAGYPYMIICSVYYFNVPALSVMAQATFSFNSIKIYASPQH